jgi:DNA-nicking Smr family endonuclease
MGKAPMKDFAALKSALERAGREAETQRVRERQAQQLALAAQRAQHAEQAIFAATVGPVHAVPTRGRAVLDRPKPEPLPRQREADERAALRQALSDDVDIESLLLTDDGLSYRRPGIGPDVATRLRRGQWAIQAQIDLHGLRRDEARETLSDFIHRSHAQGRRCLRVVHGKGHGSPGREPVLKAKVQRWLAQSAEVVAFAQASAPQGGAGALIVLLAG